ncbi:GDSL-type esterase/lipase family protein [Actinomycetota bacterium]|jgi:lysophospholipase L1-like esterase
MHVWRVVRPPLAAGTVLVGQLAHAILRDDLPTYDNQDPSGVFGPLDAPPLTIAFVGDSSVTAPGVDPLDDSWVRQVAFHLASRYRVDVRIMAVGGSKVRDVLENQLEAALATHPDIVYVSVGSNDALRGTSVRAFERDYRELVTILHARVTAVGLSGIGDLGTIPRIPALAQGVARLRARSIDHAVSRVAREFPRTVKSNAWDVMERRFREEPEMFAGDLFHASAPGHLVFAEVARPVADRLVEIWETHRADGPHNDAIRPSDPRNA